jgi:hypothetical protein
MAVTQESIVINDWGSLAVTERKRTTSAGTKSRFTIDFRANPLAIRVDPEVLGREVANAIAAAVTSGIQSITATATASTQLARKYALNAAHRGEAWVVKRYAGGKTPAALPGSVSRDRLFNDSGRLARSVFARANSEEQGYTINVAANRLDRDSFGAGFERMLARLRDLVPVLRAPETELHADAGVRKALLHTAANLVSKADERWIKAAESTLRVAKGAADLVSTAHDEAPKEPPKPKR